MPRSPTPAPHVLDTHPQVHSKKDSYIVGVGPVNEYFFFLLLGGQSKGINEYY